MREKERVREENPRLIWGADYETEAEDMLLVCSRKRADHHRDVKGQCERSLASCVEEWGKGNRKRSNNKNQGMKNSS